MSLEHTGIHAQTRLLMGESQYFILWLIVSYSPHDTVHVLSGS